jgi:transcriptional regulator with XRE-family HTH domain
LLSGRKLKQLRHARNLTARQVEEASRRIAATKQDKRFAISNGWLTQLEKGVSEPSICKIFSLSAIYQVDFLELIRLYDVDIDEVHQYQQVANASVTQLLSDEVTNNNAFKENLPCLLRQRPTSLLPARLISHNTRRTSQRNNSGRSICYGYIGLNDLTMHPMIRPGSLVRIDTTQTKLQTVAQHNEYERPIYFVELRNAYACGWCELDRSELLIVPHHSSPSRIRRFSYIRDAEIVGRVVSFETRCVDQLANGAGILDQHFTFSVRTAQIGNIEY